MIRTINRTKTIATIGPSSRDKQMMLDLIRAGVNVFRLNFSHGTHADHQEVFDRIHQINEENNLNIGILVDLQGPKIRIGMVEDGKVILEKGKVVDITTIESNTTADKLFISYAELATDAAVGDSILIDDGKLELIVTETSPITNSLKAKVINGGELSSKKGVNLPDTSLSVPSLTEKDLRDLEFALKNDPSWVALSFVRSAAEIYELKRLINAKNEVKVIAKIEKPEAVKVIDEIIEASDGIMIARGDLGVEVPMERMPLIQKDIVKRCVKASKPVIVATQILDSMITSARPTRAEINDVANDMMDGADALMLSGETAVGVHPLKVIETLSTIMHAVEEEDSIYNKDLKPRVESKTFLSDAMCYNASRLAETVSAKAIIGMTRSGYTAFMVSSYRPKAKVIIFTDNKRLLNILSLSWGVDTFFYDRFVSTDDTIEEVINILKREQVVQTDDVVINTGTMPLHEQSRTNMVKVTIVK